MGDGNCKTVWNGGGHPVRWVRADFGSAKKIHGVTVVAHNSPSPASVIHVFEVSSDGKTYTTAYTYKGVMKSEQIYVLPFSAAVTARYLRVRTTKTPSWVAWNEVAPFTCY